jgi:hypothetical protein
MAPSRNFANGALWDTGQGVFFISRTIYDEWSSPAVQSGPGAPGETALHTLGTPTEDTLATAEGGHVLTFRGGSIIELGGQASVIIPDLILAVATSVVVRDQIVINNDLNARIQALPGGVIHLIARQISHEQAVPLNAMGRDVVIVADEYDSRGGIIDARRPAGAPGDAGSKGQKGAADATTLGNRPGGVGGPGAVGHAGSAGGSVRLLCQQIITAHVVANGGAGGAGGAGGVGGDGGDGRVVHHLDPESIEGTSGGDGGPGGVGGAGGSGGQAVAIFVNAAAAPVLEVSGGPGGAGGPGGRRGVPGANSPDDDSKPGAPGPQGVAGAPGVAQNIQVDEDKFWGSVQAELKERAQDWASHRLAVGQYYYRRYNPGVTDRKDLLKLALREFDAVLRLQPLNADALRLKNQIQLKQNILGLALDLDLIPDFEEYINQFTSFKNDLTDEFNRGIGELLAAIQLDAIKAQVQLTLEATKQLVTDTATEKNNAVDAQKEAAKQLLDAQAAVVKVSGQIQAALADMNNHSISFGNVLGTVAEVGGRCWRWRRLSLPGERVWRPWYRM